MSTSDQRGGVGLDLETRHHDIRVVLEQGELERAWHMCQDLLGEYPGDLTGHALMGDIYAARRQWAEAADWYALAEEMGGGHEITQRRVAAQQMMRQAFRPQEAVREVEDLHRRRFVVQAIFAAAGLVVVLAVVIALTALFSRPTPTSSGSPSAPTPEFARPGTVLNTTPARPGAGVPSRAAGGPVTGPASRPTGTYGGVGGASPSPAGPVVVSHYMNAPATDEDYLIMRAISALTWPGGKSMSGDVAVMQDPYQGYCVITFRIPDTLAAAKLYDTVLAQSYRVITAALASSASVDGITVRALYTIQPSRQQAQTVQAFRANTTRKTVSTFSRDYPNPTTQDLLARLYGSPWWNPAVPQG